MCLRGLISDSGEQRISSLPPLTVTFTRYRSHFPFLFDLGQWMCSDALTDDARDFNKLFIWWKKKSIPFCLPISCEKNTMTEILKTYFECIVNQTSNLLFCLHGAFSFDNTSKRHWIRADFSKEGKQTFWFHCWRCTVSVANKLFDTRWSSTRHLPADRQWQFNDHFGFYFHRGIIFLYTGSEG